MSVCNIPHSLAIAYEALLLNVVVVVVVVAWEGCDATKAYKA